MRENNSAKQEEVARIFSVSADSIQRWSKIYNETGNVERKLRTDFSMQLKLDFEVLKTYCEEQGGRIFQF